MNKYDSQSEFQSLVERTKKLERRLKISTVGWLMTVGLLLLPAWAWQATSASSDKLPDTLRLRQLTIVDGNGTERVVIGAPVPEPIMLGKRFTRGGKASGILLFDEEGNERSGYVTTDGYPNVLFTLDSLERQHALLLTEPHGATTFMAWDGDNSFELNVDRKSPKLKITRQGQTVFEQPAPETEKK